MGQLQQLHCKSYKWPDKNTVDEGIANALVRYKAEFTDSKKWVTVKAPVATVQPPLFEGDVFVITVRSLIKAASKKITVTKKAK